MTIVAPAGMTVHVGGADAMAWREVYPDANFLILTLELAVARNVIAVSCP